MKKETKLCKYCKTEIPIKAKVCPNCKRGIRSFGQLFIDAVLMLIVAFIVLPILFNSCSNGNKDEPKKVGTTDSEQSNNSNEDGQNNQFDVGDIVEAKGLRITFISAGEFTSDNQFIQPKEGNMFYRMEFEFENIGTEDNTISSMVGFECYADGYACEQKFFSDDDISATLSSGKKVKGSVYFELPKTATSIQLEYKDNVWLDDKIVFVAK